MPSVNVEALFTKILITDKPVRIELRPIIVLIPNENIGGESSTFTSSD